MPYFTGVMSILGLSILVIAKLSKNARLQFIYNWFLKQKSALLLQQRKMKG